jgi:hypothetical protein
MVSEDFVELKELVVVAALFLVPFVTSAAGVTL